MRNTLLFIHILSAATWFGTSIAVYVLTPRMRAAGNAVAGPFMGVYEKASSILFGPATVLLLITGIWLVIETAYDWENAFVGIGFAAVIAGGALGGVVFAPTVRKLKAAHEAGDEGALSALYSRYMMYGLLDLAIVAFAIFSMVWKLGA